jgi:hypothetical protein
MQFDNRIGKFLFMAISQVQNKKFARRAVLRMVTNEQSGKTNAEQGMSMVMWDMLTGGALYRDVLWRVLHPRFWTRFLWNIIVSLCNFNGKTQISRTNQSTDTDHSTEPQGMKTKKMDIAALGKIYQDGEIIVRQGEIGDCMYVVQDGSVEVLIESGDQQVQLNVLGKNEFFGEMAIFNREIRSATVRAMGPARILTIDHNNLLQHIHEDPSLAYRLMEVMSARINKLSEEVGKLKHLPQDTL